MSIFNVSIDNDLDDAFKNHYFIKSTLYSNKLPKLSTKYYLRTILSFLEYAFRRKGNATLQNIFLSLLLINFVFFFGSYIDGYFDGK